MWLWALALLPLWWFLARESRAGGTLFPRAGTAVDVAPPGILAWAVSALPRLLRIGSFTCLILALAGLRTVTTVEEEVRESFSVALVLDLSSSMQAEDMGELKSRLLIAKERAARFAESRPQDRIGLVAFGGEALIRVPLTEDPIVVAEAVEALRLGFVSDGTDISTAILTGTYLLKDDPNEARVMILLTDGGHNTEGLAPARAAATAAENGIRIYAISVGEPPELYLDPLDDPEAEDIREMETVLTRAARLSGGRYFRAVDGAALDSVYAEIDRLEDTHEKIETRPIDIPREHWLFLAALVLLLVEWGLAGTRLGVLP
jgi:Ca-activated chloride channel family protein